MSQLLITPITSSPPIAALSGAMTAYGVVADRIDYYSKVQDPSEVPAAANILAFAQPFQGQADARKASIKSSQGPWDLSAHATWQMKIACQQQTVLDASIKLGPLPERPAVLSFHADDLDVIRDKDDNVVDVEGGTARLEIDGQEFTISFDLWNAEGAVVAALLIEQVVGSVVTVTQSDHVITLTTKSVGPDSRIEVIAYDDNALLDDLWALVPGVIEHGRGAVSAVADPSKVTAAELAPRLTPALPADVSVVDSALRITSDKEGDGSQIGVSGSLADALFKTKHDKVVAKISPDWEQIDSAGSLTAPIQQWIGYVKGLPGQIASVFQPLTDAASDLLQVMQGLEGAAEAVTGANLLLPPPPESVGIFGSQGITLGTHDRIVASGSHGMLFVVDGGSGEPDKGKQIPHIERIAKLAGGFAPPLRAKKKQSLGFRVYSDSVVDLNAGHGVQLLAMGRAKAKSKRPDGKMIGGVGVARVLGSYAAEIAAYEKVVISARSEGDSTDTDAKTGGRVELAGQTIAIGGVHNEEKDDQNDPYGPFDFEHPDGVTEHANFGISPFEAEYAALSEHLHLSAKNRPPKIQDGWNKDPKYLKRMAKFAWPEQLRKEHPATQRVHVHSSKEAVIVVGPYMVHIDKDAGVKLGLRKANKDPATNELDDKKPSWVLTDTGVQFVMPNDGKSDHTTVALETGKASLSGTDGSGKPGAVELAEGSAKISAGDKDSVEVSQSDGFKVAASKVDIKGDGSIKVKSGQILIG